MPGLNEMELLRLLRERARTTDVVMMTAYDDVATAVEAMRIGAADFLCKPLDFHEMRRALRRVLEGRERGVGSLLDPPARPPPTALYCWRVGANCSAWEAYRSLEEG